MNQLCYTLILVGALVPQSLFALSAREVVDSSLKHYPKVIESVLEVERQEQDWRSARGAFDAKIKGDVNARTEGYYSGDHYKGQVEKAFPFFNSKVYGGFRQGYGDFPVYDQYYETASRGESFAGVGFSLLRNSLIDVSRYQIRIKEQDKVQAEIELEKVKLAVQTLALQAYWTWLVKGYELKVYQEVLDLAKNRVRQIKRRIQVGDVAAILQTENEQYIRAREARVVKGQLEFKKASYYLSLFYRDSSGQTVSLDDQSLPELPGGNLPREQGHQLALEQALSRNLEIRQLDSQVLQARAGRQMGLNEILPKVDVNYEWKKDHGTGPSYLIPEENKLMVRLEIPIEYRKGLGKKRASETKLDQLQTKQRLLRDQVKAEAQGLSLQLNSYADIYDVTATEMKLARTLAEAEFKKFVKGASDLILVNIREEALAMAQTKNLEALLSYQLTDAELRKLKVSFL